MARRVIIANLDGLRRDFITPELTPNLHRFSAVSTSFPAYRSVFPSTTRVVSATMATGCYPACHGLQGNAMALMEAGSLVLHDAGRPGFLQHKRGVTGCSLAVPTLAQRLAPHNGVVMFNNVSPGAAYAHDPDGFGWVYHRAGSFGPGRKPVPAGDALDVTLDSAGDAAMAERFVTEVLQTRRLALSVIWFGEPDHIQHEVAMGSPDHRQVLRDADACAGQIIQAADALREAAEDILLILCSDHGHQTVTDVIDIDAELVAAGLKRSIDSSDVVVAPNGTAALVYVHPDHLARLGDLERFLISRPWAGEIFSAERLRLIGQSAANGLAFAVSMRADEQNNAFGVSGRSYVVKPMAAKPDRLGAGQHGGLGAREQSPFLMIGGGGFAPGAVRADRATIVDIAPTVLHHLGLPVQGMDGVPLQSGNPL